MPRTRTAFTLLELIVVIAILAVLVGLLLPAIQKARGAGSRSACHNNLRQIGLALHGHFDQKKRLPPGRTTTPFEHGWAIHLLPYLEAGELTEAYNFNSHWSSVSNRPVRRSWIPTFACPQ